MKNDIVKLEKGTSLDFDIGIPYSVYGDKIYATHGNDSEGYIAVIDGQLNVEKKIGRFGSGPGEFRQLIGLDVDEEGIHAMDGQLSKFMDLDSTGSIIHEYQSNKGVSRAIRLQKNLFLIKTFAVGTSENEEFTVAKPHLNTDSNIYIRRPNIVSDLQVANIQYDGFFIKNVLGNVFRVSYTSGAFVAFSHEGKYLYQAQTIDKTEPQQIKKMEVNGETHYAGNEMRTINISAACDEQFLYILSNAPSSFIKEKRVGKNSETVIDIYSVKNGDYICSFILPNYKTPNNKSFFAEDIIVNKSVLYAVYGGNIIATFKMDYSKFNK